MFGVWDAGALSGYFLCCVDLRDFLLTAAAAAADCLRRLGKHFPKSLARFAYIETTGAPDRSVGAKAFLSTFESVFKPFKRRSDRQRFVCCVVRETQEDGTQPGCRRAEK